MSNLTIDTIRPLIQDQSVDGSQVRCTFRCPVSGTVRTGTASLNKGTAGQIADSAKSRAKSRFFSSLRSSVSNLAYSLLGGGIAGSVAGEAARETVSAGERSAPGQKTNYGAAEVEAGVIAAFKNVSADFAWDGKRWVARCCVEGLLGEFEKRSAANPIAADFDREIAARIFAIIAGADGTLADAEAALIDQIAPARLGGSAGAQKAGWPSAVELEGVTAAIRPTLIQTAWAVAAVDGDLAGPEAELVAKAAAALGLDEATTETLKRDALRWALDRAVASAGGDGSIDAEERTEIVALATGLGLAADDADRAIVRFRKAKGI